MIREKLEGREPYLVLAAFCAAAAAMILVGTVALHVNVVSVCLLIIAETAIAVALYHVELWLHGVVVLLEILEGILFGRILLVLCCVFVYVAAIVTLRMLAKLGKKK